MNTLRVQSPLTGAPPAPPRVRLWVPIAIIVVIEVFAGSFALARSSGGGTVRRAAPAASISVISQDSVAPMQLQAAAPISLPSEPPPAPAPSKPAAPSAPARTETPAQSAPAPVQSTPAPAQSTPAAPVSPPAEPVHEAGPAPSAPAPSAPAPSHSSGGSSGGTFESSE